MRVHHLNCGTMRLARTRLVTHVLLVETGRELVLVDSGIGLADIADPRGRIGFYRHIARPALDPAETAVRRIERLGYDPADVAHIVVTHLDFDHIGGAADFPRARVHTTAAEWAAARTRRTFLERRRYHPAARDHEPQVTVYEPTGDTWRGFAAVRPLDGVGADIALIPLPGHTRGHAAVLVDTGDGEILHAGDAFYHHAVLSGRPQPMPLGLQERTVAHDWKRVLANHEALAELHGRGDPGLTIVNAHDPALLDRVNGPA